MNKSTKYILYGVATFAGSVVILAVVRSLVKGVAIGEGFKDLWNWAIAAFSGISAALSSYNKDKAKEEKAEKEKKDNQ